MGASARTLEVYDAYGRLIQSKKETTPDSFSTQDTKYDAQSNIVSTSLPYITNGYGLTSDTPSNGTVVYTYDGLGRVLTKSVFGTTYSYLYGARNLTVTDNAGTQHKKSYFYDANNNLSQVKEYNGASTYTTSYNYTPQNKLSSITDANGNIRNFSYFSNGLLKYQEDTHAPTDTTYTTYSYTYDVLGNLLSKTGPLGTLSYTYDAINRPSARVQGDSIYGTSTVSFTYTGCSNNYLAPCTINRGTSSTTLTYTTNGKVNSESLSIDGKTFARSYTYDIYGNPITITYPDNGKVTYTYSLDGKQTTLTYTTPSGATKNIVTDSTYNSLNSLSGMKYGNGVQMCNTYTTTSNEGAISPKLQKSVYLFNSTGCTPGIANQIELYKDEFTYKDALTPSGILSTYKDIAGTTHTKNDTLTYDNLVRLTGVSTSYDGGGAVTDTLVYDPIGNLLKQNDVLFRYSIDGTQNAHAVTSIGGSHVTYDAQGNRIQFGDSTYTWNALNQMLTASSTNGSEIYTYDEQGERIKKVIKATSIVSQKAIPATSSSSLAVFTQGDILAPVATTSMYIATSTYNKLSSISLLDKTALTTLVSGYYGSPFTSKFCATAGSPSLRQSCTASTTKQLIANNLNSRSTTTIATVGLVDDTIKIVTGALLIPSTYTGLATSSIATSSPTTFTVDSGTISSYNTFVATGIVVPLAEYSNLPFVSSSTYTSLSVVGLNDTSKVRALLTLSGCASIVSSCTTAKKVVFEKYYKESGYLLSDKALEEMWYVYAAKARLPGNSNEFTASSTVLGSISVPTITGINTSSATSTYYSGLYFNTEYTNQNASEPRLTYFNTIPYYITQSAFTELNQAGITQSTVDSYQAFIADLLGTKTASSTEYMFALKQFAQYDKKVTLSQNALKELYLVVLGAATVPNNINDYTISATFDLASYLSVQTVYGAYASTLSNTTSGCNGGSFSSGYGRCVIRVSPFSLPVATSSTVSYLLSVTAPNITEFVLNVGESSNTRAVVDNVNYGTQVPAIYSSRYAPATYYNGMLDYISGSISSDGFTQTIDVTPTIVKEKASSTEPANVLLMNRSGWTNGEQYVYQASSTVLRAYVSTPRLTLASTTLVSGVTNATSSAFTPAIASAVSVYFGEVSDSATSIPGIATSTLTFISQESYTEFASTTLKDSYALSKIFLSTSTPQCISDASTTECDKTARKAWFRTVVNNLSGFTPSQAATEEFWMVHKGLLILPNIGYASTTASTTIAGYYATSTNGTAYVGAYVISVAPGYYSTDYVATTTATSTGGLITQVGSDYVHTFTTNGTFTPSVPFTATTLIIGGGGSGGSANGSIKEGGAGAGGYIYSTSTSLNAQSYSIVIGSGGAGVGTNSNGNNGSSTTAFGYTAVGGGAGMYNDGTNNGFSGGSGGGGQGNAFSGTAGSGGASIGTPVQGNAGGAGQAFGSGQHGGGGGACGAGSTGNGSGGGAGCSNSITGTAVTYASGGNAGDNSPCYQVDAYGAGSNAKNSATTCAGKQGVVIVRYNPLVPGHWVTTYYATTTTFYLATSTGLTQGVFASTTFTAFPVFSRSNLPVSLSTSTSYVVSTTTIPGYWATQVTAPTSTPSGGTVSTSTLYTIHKFTSSGSLIVPSGINAQVLVVAGGGSGSAALGGCTPGAGGAGGYIASTTIFLSAGTKSITVGAGGSPSGSPPYAQNGGNSTFDTITAIGGGGGGSPGQSGGSGGSGVSCGGTESSHAGTAGQGNASGATSAYRPGGGGGAGGAGTAGSGTGAGGIGIDNDFSGATSTYAVGGNGNGAGASGATNTGNGGSASFTSSASGGSGGSGIVIVRYLSSLFLATTTQVYIATTTIYTPITHLDLVPSGLLSDLQYNSLYSTSTFALATSTKVVSEDTYNELLRTPIRINTDVDTIFDYALPFATSTCSGQSATSSCVIGAQKSKVKDTISAFSGFVLSDAALEELYRVKNNELSIVPVSLANATVSTTTRSVIVPLLPSESYVTFATTTGVATSTGSVCSFGITGSTTKTCYIDLPYINSSVSSLILSYTVSPTSISTSTVRNTLTVTTATTTTSTSTPTITTTTATSTLTGTKSATSTFSFDLTSLYQTFLNSSSPTLTLVPDGNATSSNTYTLGTSTLTITRTITVPRISYASSSLLAIPFSRTTIATTSMATSTTSVDLTSLPPLTFSATFLSPVGRIATTTSSYAGTVVDTTPIPLPVLPQFQMSSIIWPSSFATSSATTTINLLTAATTTQSIVYSPFANYVDASSTVTTYFTLNGVLVGAYTYQKGNEASTGKITYAHTNYLGTPVIETDDRGDIVQMDITDVYGNYVQRDQRKDHAYHTKGFTSQEYDDVTGLNYFHARFLDPKAHSFLSVDPLNYSLPQEYLIDPQQLNTYSYARNNPIVFVDPDGQYIEISGSLVSPGRSWSGGFRFDQNGVDYFLSGGYAAQFGSSVGIIISPSPLSHQRQSTTNLTGQAAYFIGGQVSKDVATYSTDAKGMVPNGKPSGGLIFGVTAGVSLQQEVSAPLYVWNKTSSQSGQDNTSNRTPIPTIKNSSKANSLPTASIQSAAPKINQSKQNSQIQPTLKNQQNNIFNNLLDRVLNILKK
jgi:RHS repeat-associated protein